MWRIHLDFLKSDPKHEVWEQTIYYRSTTATEALRIIQTLYPTATAEAKEVK